MSAPGILERPELEDGGLGSGGWIVTVYDNDSNTYEQVMIVLMAATQCSAEEAYIEAWEIDHLGKSVVHHAGESECQRVASIVRTIGIEVKVTEE